jgi:hypothetical protein
MHHHHRHTEADQLLHEGQACSTSIDDQYSGCVRDSSVNQVATTISSSQPAQQGPSAADGEQDDGVQTHIIQEACMTLSKLPIQRTTSP